MSHLRCLIKKKKTDHAKQVGRQAGRRLSALRENKMCVELKTIQSKNIMCTSCFSLYVICSIRCSGSCSITVTHPLVFPL